jgi:hypothetical protein
MIDLTKKSTDELREELIAALKRHDWYYDRSDDPRYYHAGRASEMRINALVGQVPDGQEIYNKSNPFIARAS